MWNSPYAKYLLNVEKPGRYVGGEFGSITPNEDAEVKMAFAFPDAYEIGMSHIGLSILYEIVNANPRFSAERVFMPWPDMMQVIKENDLSLLTLESQTVLNELDVVGFSLQYELTFTNLIAMLDMGKIPRHANERTEDDAFVMVGGPVAVQCEPIAPFVDFVVLGDGEESITQILETISVCKKENCSREQTLLKVAQLDFVFAPNLYEREEDELSKRWVVKTKTPLAKLAAVKKLEDFPSGNGPVSTIQAVFDRYSIEIGRGCTQGCRFCQAGYLYRPVRERSIGTIDSIIKKATCSLGFDEVSLSSLSSADHSQIDEIMTELGDEYTKQRVSFSVPSLRAYGLSDTVIEVLSKLRASGVTLAPEAGSQRLRDLVNKNIEEQDVLDASKRFFNFGFTKIKLYFMLGLPTETDDDLHEIVDLALKIKRLGQGIVGKRADVTVSVSTFVPKPFTPFEREEMVSFDEIKRRQKLLHEYGWANRIRVKTHDVKMSILEGIFARGDIKLSSLLERAVDKGACFDGWDELYNNDIWSELLKDISVESYLAKFHDDSCLPWNSIDNGVKPSFRLAERDEAYLYHTTKPCGVFVIDGEKKFVCHGCGIKCKASMLNPKKVVNRTLESSLNETVTESVIATSSKAKPEPAKVIQAGESSSRYRIKLAFWGRQVFVGHLDRMRHLMRSMKRADLKVWYTQGFHPKPKIEAPPPLPLGTAALDEPFDVWLVDAPSEVEIVKRLNNVMPHDMKVANVIALKDGEKKVSQAYGAVEYVVFLNEDEHRLSSAISTFLQMESCVVQREKKGKVKNIDIRPYVLDIKITDMSNIDLPKHVKDVKHGKVLTMTLKLTGSGGTRPKEVLTSVLPKLDDEWIIRAKWIKD